MTGVVNQTGARSGIVGTVVGTPAAGGITQSTTFQLTTNHTSTGVLTAWDGASNLDGAGAIGTLLTHSSGIVTLPVGVWLINAMFGVYHTGGDNAIIVRLLTGGGTRLVESLSGFDIDDSSTDIHKYNYAGINYVVQSNGSNTFKFAADSVSSGSYIYGSAGWSGDISATHASFIKLTETASSA